MAVVFIVLSAEYGQSQTSPRLKNATVLIIRHAEKPETGKHLSPAGVRRAQPYVAYFESLRIDSHPVKLDHLFAAQESKHSDRCHETLLPLSNALHLKIHSTTHKRLPYLEKAMPLVIFYNTTAQTGVCPARNPSDRSRIQLALLFTYFFECFDCKELSLFRAGENIPP
jgi:hypothetical protein